MNEKHETHIHTAALGGGYRRAHVVGEGGRRDRIAHVEDGVGEDGNIHHGEDSEGHRDRELDAVAHGGG